MTLIKKHRKNLIKKFEFIYKKEVIYIKVKKNKLSKSYKLSLDKKDLNGLVSIPHYIKYEDGAKFAQDNLKWISEEIEKFKPIIKINNGAKIKFFDDILKIKYITSSTNEIRLARNVLEIFSKKQHSDILLKWIKSEVRKSSNIVINDFSRKLNVKVSKIKISNSFSYWGSCNSKNEISINWRLIFCPQFVLNYIIAHELSHLIEFNHSKNFWNLVDKLITNRLDAQKWLKQNDNYMYRLRLD
jgi:predicted metal-dependent hydrolase